jgi:hypothetical protein
MRLTKLPVRGHIDCLKPYPQALRLIGLLEGIDYSSKILFYVYVCLLEPAVMSENDEASEMCLSCI